MAVLLCIGVRSVFNTRDISVRGACVVLYNQVGHDDNHNL